MGNVSCGGLLILKMSCEGEMLCILALVQTWGKPKFWVWWGGNISDYSLVKPKQRVKNGQ